MSGDTRDQDVTVVVARAESRVLAAAREIADVERREGDRLDAGHSAARDVWREAHRELWAAIKALASADEAELAEIAAHEAEMQQRIADHEMWLDQQEGAAGEPDWWMDTPEATIGLSLACHPDMSRNSVPMRLPGNDSANERATEDMA